jgi:uncharacterized protein (DUF58 family)
MSNKLFCVAVVIMGLVMFSLIMMDGRLLLLAMPFLAYLFVGILQSPTEVSLIASRVVEKPGAVAQEPVRSCVTVVNQGQSLVNLFLHDLPGPSMTIQEGRVEERTLLSAGQAVQLNYILKAQRGVYTWRSIHAVASDPFGLFEFKQDIPAPGELVVRPGALILDRVPIRPWSTLHTPGPIPIRHPGLSSDFLGVREYRAGDSLRRLNWQLAARHPHEQFTNEFEREEMADFGLILDARKLSNAHAAEEVLFENSIRAAISLSETFLKQGNRVSLLVFGESMSFLLPGYGKKQLKRIVWSLARAKLGSSLSFGYLDYFPARLFPGGSYLILLSTLGTQDYETYARLRSWGHEVLLISPNPIDILSRERLLDPVADLAVRAAQVERVIELKRLMKLGVHVIDWKVQEPFEAVLQRATAHLVRRKKA